MFFEQRTFTNDQGLTIHCKTPVDANGEADGPPQWFGIGVLQLTFNGQPMQRQFVFQIEANTLGDAFAGSPLAYEAGAKNVNAEIRREIAEQQRQILVAGANGSAFPNNNGNYGRRMK